MDDATPTVHKLVKHLTPLLADTYVLAVKTHGAHWNVTGTGFFRLHPVFDEQYHALLEAADLLAERIRALGVAAPGSMKQLLALSSIGEPPEPDEKALVKALRNDHLALAKTCQDVLVKSRKAEDEATSDLIVGRLKAHDKVAWMLTATLGE